MVQLEKDLKASEATLVRTQESHANQAAMLLNLQAQLDRQAIALKNNSGQSPSQSGNNFEREKERLLNKAAQDYETL